jgi:KDO2-lipid IV(A) lauroyltransferase
MPKQKTKTSSTTKKKNGTVADRLIYWISRVVLGGLHLVPYGTRIRIGGWFFSRIVSPIAGYPSRIKNNLDLVLPDLDPLEKKRLIRSVPENFGRTVIELFSPSEFLKVSQATAIHGPGLEALIKAREERRPSILVSGHFGNYDVVRSRMIKEGFDVGGLYRPMNNVFFNEYYVSTISKIGLPLFQRGRKGMAHMVKFLRSGGTLAILIDQHMSKGARLTFFGQPAHTALSAAQLALKYDAVLIPCYAIREPDGLSFRIEMEAPIANASAEAMTQALNDSLEARVRDNMDQWLWVHRRWKS